MGRPHPPPAAVLVISASFVLKQSILFYDTHPPPASVLFISIVHREDRRGGAMEMKKWPSLLDVPALTRYRAEHVPGDTE